LLCFSCFFFVRDVSLSLTSFQIIELCMKKPLQFVLSSLPSFCYSSSVSWIKIDVTSSSCSDFK
jgi:hypothetical protein